MLRARDRHIDDLEAIIDRLGRVATESMAFIMATAVSAIEQCLWGYPWIDPEHANIFASRKS